MMNNQDVSISCEALLAELPKKLYPKKSKILLPFTVVLFIVVPLTAVSAWLYWETKESLILGILIFFTLLLFLSLLGMLRLNSQVLYITHEGFCLLKQSQAHTDHIELIPWQAIEGFGIMRFQFQTIAIYQFTTTSGRKRPWAGYTLPNAFEYSAVGLSFYLEMCRMCLVAESATTEQRVY